MAAAVRRVVNKSAVITWRCAPAAVLSRPFAKASTAALRKAAASVAFTGKTATTNLLPYQPGLREAAAAGMIGSSAHAPGWEHSWVLKYGGSSVGPRLPRVCESIFEHVAAGHDASARGGLPPARVAVVVSAMGKTTDMLLDAAGAAQNGNLNSAEVSVMLIRCLAVDNARNALTHFGLKGKELEDAIDEVVTVVSNTFESLSDHLQGVSLLRDLSPRTLDFILSHGERASANVAACVLRAVVRAGAASGGGGERLEAMGKVVPICVEATEFMRTDETFGAAAVDFGASQKALHALAKDWPEGALPIFTGFIARSASGETTTLGRNGSDYSAAVIAAALGAERVVINTDVPGIFTADPRLVPDAYPVPEMSYTEAVELSIYGSKIFHPKTMVPLIRHDVPMIIRNTGDAPNAPATTIRSRDAAGEPAAPGTLSSVLRSPWVGTAPLEAGSCHGLLELEDAAIEGAAFLEPVKKADVDAGAVCVASLEDLSFITVRAEIHENTASEVSARALHALDRAKLTGLWSDQRSGSDSSILVRKADREQASDVLLKEFKDQRLLELSATEPVTLLSLVPSQNASRIASASRFFNALAKANVKIHRVVCGASTSSISCLIDARETALAVRTAHNAFNLSKRTVSLLLLGDNRAARFLLEELLKRQSVPGSLGDIRVCGMIGADGAEATQLRAEGLPIREVLAQLSKSERAGGGAGRAALAWSEQYERARDAVLGPLQDLPTPVVVDCSQFVTHRGEASVSEAQLACYLACLESGVRLAVSNAGMMNAFAETLQASGEDDGSSPMATLLQRRGLLRYDSAAAAGLPLLEAVREQLLAGRRVSVVGGAFSATIGFVLDRITRCGDSLRDAVELAWHSGITEPRLTTDLGGKDVAAKLRVTAFGLGCMLEDADLSLTPLVPTSELPDDSAPTSTSDYAAGARAVLEALDEYDVRENFSKRAVEAYANGVRWRYIGTLELLGNGKARATVGIEEVREEHFAFGLRGQEIACALWEDLPVERAKAAPLLVLRGQGAGRAAGTGVLGDVMQLVGL